MKDKGCFMRNKSSIEFYNMIFPIWLIWLFPLTWIIILPGNFIIDSLVLLITLKLLNINEKKNIYKKTILKVWGYGFLADLIGTIIMIIPGTIENFLSGATKEWWYKNLTMPVHIVHLITFIQFLGYYLLQLSLHFLFTSLTIKVV